LAVQRSGGFLLHFAWLLLLVTAIPWFSHIAPTALNTHGIASAGGLSGSQSYLNFGLALIGIVIAFFRGDKAIRLSPSVILIFVYAGITVIGAGLANLSIAAAGLLAIRLVVCVLASLWVLQRAGLKPLLLSTAWLACAISVVSVGAYLVGLNHFVVGLPGFLPPMQSNGLGAIAAIGILILLDVRMSMGKLALSWWIGLATLGITLILTDSRTSFLGLFLAVLVLLLTHRRSRIVVGLLLLTLTFSAVSFVHVGNQSILNDVISKGHSTSALTNLTVRFDEGSAAIAAQKTDAEKVFGQGLPQKYVSIPGLRKRLAPVDGGWYAAYLESGLVGATVLALAVLVGGWSVLRRRVRIGIGLWVLLLVISLTQALYNDLSIGLILLAVISTRTARQDYFPRKVVTAEELTT